MYCAGTSLTFHWRSWVSRAVRSSVPTPGGPGRARRSPKAGAGTAHQTRAGRHARLRPSDAHTRPSLAAGGRAKARPTRGSCPPLTLPAGTSQRLRQLRTVTHLPYRWPGRKGPCAAGAFADLGPSIRPSVAGEEISPRTGSNSAAWHPEPRATARRRAEATRALFPGSPRHPLRLPGPGPAPARRRRPTGGTERGPTLWTERSGHGEVGGSLGPSLGPANVATAPSPALATMP